MSAVSPRLAGYLFAIGAPLCWSVGGVVMRSVEADAWQMVFWRSTGHVVALGLIFAIWGGKRILRDFVRAGWAAAATTVLIGLTFILHVLAMSATTVANVLVLQSLSPLLAAILAWAVLGERVKARGWVAIAIAFAGLLPVFGTSIAGGRWLGDAFAIGVAVASAFNVIVVRHTRRVNLLPGTVLGAALSVGVAALLTPPFEISIASAGSLMALGVLQMSVGLTFFYFALQRLPAAEVTLITLLEPVLGPIWVWLIVGEEPALLTLAGGGVILFALGLNASFALRRGLTPREVPA
jgi:drug/metabolite transporter (DMT)-like permease